MKFGFEVGMKRVGEFATSQIRTLARSNSGAERACRAVNLRIGLDLQGVWFAYIQSAGKEGSHRTAV